MNETTQAAQTIAKFLQSFITGGGMRLRFAVKARTLKQPGAEIAQDAPRQLYVEFTGPDTSLLTARNGELLNALEHIATKMLCLEAEEHDRIAFDADHFKANRDRQMHASAAAAIERVQATGQPHAFSPMTSRERRMLHLILKESGLPTASSGEGPGRFVVLYPEGADTSTPFSAAESSRPPQRRHDINQVRNAFRPRY
jgi:spoIIIJ-associated protein